MNEGKLKVAVCDDEPRAVTVISASVKSVFEGMKQEILLESFLSGKDLLDRMTTYHFDLIFLDISMPGMDGIELGKELKKKGSAAELVFVSSRTDRVFDTFAVHPFGFVRKTRFVDDITEVITRYLESREGAGANDRYAYFKDQQGTVAIDVSHVTYAESIRNTQILHFDDSKDEHKLYSRMETLEEELKKFDFLRIHKGYLVNCHFIYRFDSKNVILSNGVELPVGRSRQKEAMQEYLKFASRQGTSFFGVESS